MYYCLITGGASGIGLATAQLLLKKGEKVIVVDKNKPKVNNNNLISFSLDISNRNDLSDFLIKLKKDKLFVNRLVNNAGFQENVDILDITLKQWHDLFKINLEAAFIISQQIAKQMIENKIKGAVVNVTSIHGQIIREIAHYSASKAALDMLTKEYAYKLAKYNIRVNAVAPGAIDTPLIRKDLGNEKLIKEASNQIPMQRLGKSEEIANVIEFLLSDKASYVTGSTVIVDGGLSLVI